MLLSKADKTREKIKATGNAAVNVVYALLLALAITALMVLYLDRVPSNMVEGKIAMQDIRADQNYEIIDQEATDLIKQDAELKSLAVYTFDTSVASDAHTQIEDAFTKSRLALAELNAQNQARPKLTSVSEGALKQGFFLGLGIVLSDSDYQMVRDDGFSQGLQKKLVEGLRIVQNKPIIQDKSLLLVRQGLGVVLRKFDSTKSEYEEVIISNSAVILSLDEARALLEREIDTAVMTIAPQLVRVNVVYDKDETELRREHAMKNVQEIIHKLQKGQTIIRRGDRLEKRHIIILNGIRAKQLQTNVILKFIGVFILVTSVLLAVYAFASTAVKSFKPARKDLYFLGIMLVAFLVILRVGSFVSSTLQDAVPFNVDLTTFYYLIPIAAGAMIVRLIFNQVTTFVFLVVLSLFCGLFLENNFQMTAYYFLSAIFGAYFVGGVERRSSVISRGLYLGLIQVLLVFSLSLINTISGAATVDWGVLGVDLVFAFCGGLVAALTVLAVSPAMEALFNYTTNIQLLELANMNHPLLREMIVHAPGTYLHSQLVGTLAEAATRAIGGNALLARVGSYYHDIGKMKKPQYFIENQKGANPHDKLAPSMSALIIDNHVKDGIEMAREYKLPRLIADFIPEHQGTKLIGFFYHKARQEAGTDADKIDERDYRYVGPKPQSREAGVVMLADTVEAAVRSMADKSPQKIRMQVEKLVNMHFVDGQLDECELTLRDLHLIVDAFVKIFMGIYHHRVEYPDGSQKVDIKPVDTKNTNFPEGHDRQSTSLYGTVSPLFKEKR